MPLPGVADLEAQPAAVLDRPGDRDPAAARRVAERVGDEVRQHFADPDRVDLDDREVAVDRRRDLHARGARRRLERADDIADQDVGVGRLGMEGERPGLREGEGPEVVDQPPEDPRLIEDDAEMGRVGRIDTVDDRLEVALDDGQRRPELVADVGQQRPALGLVGLEPRDHRVETVGQLAHHAQAAGRAWADIDPDRVVAGLDPARGVDQPVERLRGQEQGPAHPDQHPDDEREGHQPGHRPELRDDDASSRRPAIR